MPGTGDRCPGPAVIPAGFNGTSISFARPMPNAGYHVVLSPHHWGRPFATDDACRFPVVGGKTTSGFTINLRRCWFEGNTVPTDPAEVDLRLDWIAIEGRRRRDVAPCARARRQSHAALSISTSTQR